MNSQRTKGSKFSILQKDFTLHICGILNELCSNRTAYYAIGVVSGTHDRGNNDCLRAVAASRMDDD